MRAASGFLLLLLCTPAWPAISLVLIDPSYGTCGNVSINGVVLPSAGDTISQLVWDWGDGLAASSSFFPAVHKFNRVGTYSVLVTATSAAGEKATATSSVTIDAVCTTPVTNLFLNDPSYGACGNVSINNGVVLPAGEVISSMTWDWGDGTRPHVSFFAASHKYSRDATFPITVNTVSLTGVKTTVSGTAVVRNSGVAACAWGGPFYTTSRVAGVDFEAGETAKATSLIMTGPHNIAIDQKDVLYVSDNWQDRVWRITPEGVASLAVGGSRRLVLTGPGPAGVAFPAREYPFAKPTAITFDQAGTPYFLRSDPFYDRSGWIYKLTAEGISLAATASPVETSYQDASFAADPLNNLYIGDWFYGRIVKISPSGEATTFATGLDPQGMQWRNGLLYVSSYCSRCDGKIATIDAEGNVTTLYSGPGIQPGLAVGSRGEVYFRNTAGVVRIEPDGTSGLVPGSAGLQFANLAIDSAGTLYNGSFFDGLIRKLAGGTVSVMAGGTDQSVPATESPLVAPGVLAISADGDLLVADDIMVGANLKVRAISRDGRWRLLDSPQIIKNPANPPFAMLAQGNSVHALVDYPEWKIVRYNADQTSEIEIAIGNANQISSASAMAPDGSGGYYVGGTGPNRENAIWRVDSTGGLQLSSPLTTALGNSPVTDMSADGTGNLYIAQNARVLKVASGGAISTFAGTGEPGFSGENGPAKTVQLNGVTGVGADAAGNLFVAEKFNRRIRMVTPDGTLRTIAVTGQSQQISDTLGTWMDAPTKIATDGRNLYFSLPTNGLVKKLTPNRPVRLTGTSGDGQQAAVGTSLAALIVQAIGDTSAPVEGMLVTWTVTSGAATLSAGTAVTDSGGLARVNPTLGRSAGTVTITASVTGLPAVTFTVTATAATTTDLTVTVPATADPWLAGMPPGSKASCDVPAPTICDTASAQSPLLVMLQAAAGSAIDISATGTASPDGSQYFGPDGNPNWTLKHDAGAENGISDVSAPLISLVGVFLGPDPPNASAAPGPAGDPTHPGLKQVFIIGSRGTVIVPAGGTRLFLGTMDLLHWADNAGSFAVKLTASCPASAGACLAQPASAASLKIVTGDNQTGGTGRLLNSALAVQTLDNKGAPLPGVPVTFAVTSGAASLGANVVLSGTDGIATVTVTLGATPGPVVVTATAGGLGPLIFHATAIVPPQIAAGGVVNAGTPAPISPGGLATLYGANLASRSTTNQALPVPTVLGGISVWINGRAVPVTFAGTGQVNFQVPYEIAPGTASVKVSVNGVDSLPETVTVAAAAVGLFSIVQNQDYSLNLESKPAVVGSYITVYGTGGGAVNPPVATGTAASAQPLSAAVTTITATLNGVPATVIFAGLTPANVGLMQFNVQIPQMESGRYSVQVSAGGIKSNTIPVWVGQ